MTNPDSDFASDMANPAPTPRADITAEMRKLVTSAEPAVVFSSLAKLCVPLFSDGCTVDIVESDHASYRISYPPRDSAPSAAGLVGDATICTRIEAAGPMDTPAYSGVVTHSWHTHQPTPADVTQASLLARHAVTTICLERLNGDADHDHEAIEQLRAAVLANRDIGLAMGILMSTRNLSQDEAFSVLSVASRGAERRMSDIAMEIIQHSNTTPPPRPRSPRTYRGALGPAGCRDKP